MKKKLIKTIHFLLSAMLMTNLLWTGLVVKTVKAETLIKKSSDALAVQPAPHNKFALLVGVEGYNHGSKAMNHDWWNLHTKGDLEIIANQLITKFQFKPENIKVLCDAPVVIDGKTIPPVKPTHKAIIDAFRSFLIGQVKPENKDVVYFHFSGHGQKVPDDDKHGPNPVVGDELDGYDESIIPIDYVSQTDPSNNIRDDEIGILLDELSKKNPANVTISLDSCFSGTATRGDVIERGSDWKGTPVDPKMVRGKDEHDKDFIAQGSSNRGGNEEQNYVFLSAASQNQTAKEFTENGQAYGAFSYSLAKAMESSGDKTTYRDLFGKVSDVITQNQRDQNPQIEGSQLDKILMEDGALPPKKFVSVKFNNAGNPYFTAGALQGMTKGSKFNLCPADAKDCSDTDKIATAEIVNVNPTTSTIKLDKTVAPDKIKTASRAFEMFHSYEGVLKVAVKQDERGSKLNLENIFTNLGITEKVSADDKTWNVLIRPATDEDVKNGKVAAGFHGIVLERAADKSIVKAIPDGAEDAAKQIQDALSSEANWITIKSLSDTADAELANTIQLTMIPLELKKDETTGEVVGYEDRKDKGLPTRGGNIELKVGDYVRLEITNKGTEPVYVTILDLQANGKIAPAFPRTNSDNKIPADGKPHKANTFRITEPLGMESFRAIITKTPTDFTPLIDPELLKTGSRGGERGGNAANTPLGRILINSQTGQRSESVMPPASWATATIDFFVIPK